MAIYVKKCGTEAIPAWEFKCDECGCEWVATEEDVIAHADDMRRYVMYHTSSCPCCGTVAFSSNKLHVRNKLVAHFDAQDISEVEIGD